MTATKQRTSFVQQPLLPAAPRVACRDCHVVFEDLNGHTLCDQCLCDHINGAGELELDDDEIDWDRRVPFKPEGARITCAVCRMPAVGPLDRRAELCPACLVDLDATWAHLQRRADSVRDQKFAALNVWRDVVAAADRETAQRYAATVNARWPMDGSEMAPSVAIRLAKSRALGDGLSILLNAEAERDAAVERLAEERAQIGRGLDEVQKARQAPRAPAPRPNEYAIPADATPLQCRSCGAGMVFIQTPAGKALPLSVATIQERDGVRYALPHFADCKDSKLWSKK